MRAYGIALIAAGIGVAFSSVPADAARFVVEYNCRDSATLVRLASAREKAHPRIFQSHVHKAVVTGHCKVVRYHRARPSKVARKRVKSNQAVVPAKKRGGAVTATVRERPRIYVPAGAVPTIRVSDASSARRHVGYDGYNGFRSFPTPRTFMPVR